MEDDFYATIKFKSGEEVFARVAASEENDRTMLVVHNPIVISELKGKHGISGYKVEPWLKTTQEDMFIVNLQDVLTLSESADMHMILMHQNFIKDSEESLNHSRNHSRLNKRMGYLGTVKDTKEQLEKIFKNSPKSKS